MVMQLCPSGQSALAQAWEDPAPAALVGPLAAVTNWGYQLQRLDPARMAATDHDLIVIDYSRDGSDARALSAQEVAALKRKPGGQARLVLAYLSIGEAEDYRGYWQREWRRRPPAWLVAENPDWPGNYTVAFWNAEWQALIFGSAEAYLDKIIAAGFDGVYLDRVDVFDEDIQSAPRGRMMRQMVDFVEALAAYARARRPGFVVVPQNGEELLADARYRGVIDGIAKEDLFYGVDGDGVANGRADVDASLAAIALLRQAGKPLLLVEYLDRPDQIETIRARARELAAPLFIANRELDHARSH